MKSTSPHSCSLRMTGRPTGRWHRFRRGPARLLREIMAKPRGVHRRAAEALEVDQERLSRTLATSQGRQGQLTCKSCWIDVRRTTPGTPMKSDVPVPKAWTRCAVCATEVPLDQTVVPQRRPHLPRRARPLCPLARGCSHFLSIAFAGTNNPGLSGASCRLGCSRRATHFSRWVPENPDEGLAHPLRVREAYGAGDRFKILATILHTQMGSLPPSSVQSPWRVSSPLPQVMLEKTVGRSCERHRPAARPTVTRKDVRARN
jgi:hypothetical protein